MKLQFYKIASSFRRNFTLLSAVSLSTAITAGLLLTWYLVNFATRESIREGELHLADSLTHVLNILQPMDSGVKSLSGSPWILPALESPGPVTLSLANSVLDRYAGSFGASACYLLDARGTVIATSNRNTPDSFLGESFAFRPYFTSALAGKGTYYFAFGIKSKKKGYYSSYPVKDARGTVRGVVVMKIDLNRLPEDYVSHSFLLGPEGIIFLRCHDDELIQSMWKLDDAMKSRVMGDRQYETFPVDHIFEVRPHHGSVVSFNGKSYIYLQHPFRNEGWSIVHMVSTSKIFLFRLIGIIITILMVSFTLFFITVLVLRERTARKTKESEERYRIAMETTGQLIYDCDIRSGVIKWSGAIEAISGYTPGEFQTLGLSSRKTLIHPDDRAVTLNLLDTAIRERTHFHAGYRFIRKDGSFFHADDTGDFTGAPGGKPFRMLGSIRDVSEQKISDNENTALQRITDLFLTTDSISRIYQELPRILATVFDFPLAAMEIYDKQTREMVFVGTYGFEIPEGRELRIPDTDTISGTVARTGRAIAETGAGAMCEYRHPELRNLRFETFICAPIKSSLEALGTLSLGDTIERKEAPRVLRALMITAGQLAMELGRKNAEEFIRESLNEKEVLLREIHHRVKNNMQVIISLLNLQSGTTDDPLTHSALQDSMRRIRTMAVIHERLYHSQQFTSINFRDYVESLIQELVRSMSGGNITYRLDSDDVSLPLDKAIPCGLLLNELITNSIKHAFPGGTGGEITVSLRYLDGDKPRNRITVSDNGSGMPGGHLAENGQTLGTTLITALVKQLQAEFTSSNENGAHFEITFPAE